ncbi:PREDICTED: endothelin-1-like [Nanorana parkeri]|uniref:endothelin-1-like n=1 Tax=Nanorana parkeri TaxID=125878 RepID=UPI000854CA23|nr:PREDICTED: endothelin-1-like [Nanorana parkeri]
MEVEIIFYLLLVLFQGIYGTGLSSTYSDESSPSETSASPHVSGTSLRPRRFKRCSCSSLMDKECVYFCHLDIIWINTPEKTVPYGLGGPRLKRSLQDTKTESTDRCICAKREDKKCLDFCQASAELSVQPSLKKERRQNQEAKVCSGLEMGSLCVEKHLHSNTERMNDITRSIKRSFAIARLLKKLNVMKGVKHPWTQRKRGLWKHIKTTS